MRVFQSAVLRNIPGIGHATAPLQAQPLTFSGNAWKTVAKNRQHFLDDLGIKLDSLVLCHQVHGSRIRIVGDAERGAGAQTPKNYLEATDGLLTQRPDVALGIFTADCIPVILADPITGWIGALHIGWRGAVKNIAGKAISLLKKQGVDLRTVKIWFGPGICGTHFLVKQSCAKQLVKAFYGKVVTKKKADYAVDLQKGVISQLLRQGIRKINIETSKVCTFENRHLPSGRRDGSQHANTLTVIVRQAQSLDLRGKRVAVYGLGIQGGGEAAVRYAVQLHAQVTVIDTKPASAFKVVRKKLKDLPAKYFFGQSSLKHLSGAEVIIKNPGVPPSDPALRRMIKQGAIVTSDIGIFRTQSRNPVVAITGTKGKTTVATWLAMLLRTKVKGTVLAGNVRHSPLLEASAFDGRTPVVLELSSFQLEALDVALAPKLALVTNLFPDHLDRHKTMRKYAAVKAKILKGQTAKDFFVAPLDSEWRHYNKAHTKAKIYFTNDKPHPLANAFIESGWIILRIHGKRLRVIPILKLKQQDIGTIRCAVSVALAGYLLGYPVDRIRRVLGQFAGVPERFEVVRTYKSRIFINNTTATNPAAAVAGIKSVRERCIVIAGGTDKGLPKQLLVQALNKIAAVVFLPGTATNLIAPKVKVHCAKAFSMNNAVRAAFNLSKPGDTILLSPGAASFGLFKNEFDRGDKFVKAVKALR